MNLFPEIPTNHAKSDIPALEDKDARVDDADESTAPLLDHLVELRSRLIKALLAIFVGAIISYAFATQIYNFLVAPYVEASVVFREGDDKPLEFIFLGPLEFFFAKLRLALFAGVFLAFPLVAWQFYKFVAPGLLIEEKGALYPFLFAAPTFFVAGASFVYYIIIPLLARFALNQEQVASDAVSIEHIPSVGAYLSLIMTLMIVFGLSFQLPVVLTLLGKVGLVSSEFLKKGRKFALVGILAVAAFLTPPDFISQILLTVPVMLLYELSIICVRLIEKSDSEKAKELV